MSGMHSDDSTRVAGLLLAAGAGSRYGTPKALVVADSGEPWLVRAALTLEDAGCDPILVVLGAGGDDAEHLLVASAARFARPRRLRIVHAERWADGLSASIEAGLDRLSGVEAVAVALVPVDVPDLSAATVLRVVGSTAADAAVGPAGADSLRQAHFRGRPGHPVVIGRSHWAPLKASLAGDSGARPYLVAHNVTAVDCDDLGTGLDVDMPPQ
jgi:CTP:molybdopterin cytidylyltransferase MocA